MNLSELSSFTDREIIDSITRTAGTPIEKALQSELTRRQNETINSLNTNIYNLNINIEKLLQSLNKNSEK